MRLINYLQTWRRRRVLRARLRRFHSYMADMTLRDDHDICLAEIERAGDELERLEQGERV